jgi:hypothetical protein
MLPSLNLAVDSQSELWISVLEKAYMKEHDASRFFSAIQNMVFNKLSIVRYLLS